MMLKKNKILMDFLLSRRSASAKTLVEPAPDRSSLENILKAAARSPDHGKIVPWRFLILKKKVIPNIAKKILEFGALSAIDSEKLNRNANTFLNAPLIVAVVSSPNSIERIPLIEQHLSAGAVCLALLNAAHAEGWGANWLTGWMSYDKNFLKTGLTLLENEFVAGFIHIGTKTIEPKERERPDMKSITSWLEG
jgi:nitroreductase